MEIIQALPGRICYPGALPRLRPTPYPARSTPLVPGLPPPPQPNTIPHVPNEIISLIIKHITSDDYDEHMGEFLEPPIGDLLAWWDRRALVRCCLVSKAFLGPARKALYESVFIEDPGGDLAAAELMVCTLKTAPHLASLVRAIIIRREEPPQGWHAGFNDPFKHLLCGVLKACRNIETLDLDLREQDCKETAAFLAEVREHTSDLQLRVLKIDFRPWTRDVRQASDEHTFPMSWVLCEILRKQSTLKQLSLIINGPFSFLGEPRTLKLEELEVAFSFQTPADLELVSSSSRTSLTNLWMSYFADDEPDWSNFPFPNLDTLRLVRIPTKLAAFHSRISHLPLRRLNISDANPPPHYNPFPHLPPTITHLLIPIPDSRHLVAFLASPHARTLARGFFDPHPRPVTPWAETKLALAARDLAFQLVQPSCAEPEEEEDFLDDKDGLRPLSDFWPRS